MFVNPISIKPTVGAVQFNKINSDGGFGPVCTINFY